MPSNRDVNFAAAPVTLDMPRSTFNRDFTHKTTFNVGELIPFYVDEALPGDTFNVEVASALRLQTLIRPPFDDLYLETFFFAVPLRLVWSHTKEFFGENNDSAWIPQLTYSKPQTSPPSGGWAVGTIADYMTIPTGVEDFTVDSTYFRAYALIVNEWFRSEVVQSPVVINVGDSNTVGSNGSNYITDLEKGGKPFVVNKFYDVFTGCTPTAQKGPAVMLPLGDDNAWPVVPMKDRIDPKVFPKTSGGSIFETSVGYTSGSSSWQNMVNGSNYPLDFIQPNSSGYLTLKQASSTSPNPVVIPDTGPYNRYAFTNLYAVSPGGIAGATINELREAFQLQKFYEREALGGSRYTELIRSMFSVSSPDARLQRPEYLGGMRRRLNVNQIVQQSETGSTPQGNLAAISLTTDHYDGFRKSFTEHTIIIGVLCCRYKHSYSQGLNRMFSRKTRFDYYWPLMANLGNQSVKNKEIYLQGSTAVDSATGDPYDDEVFGYQEAWYDYRYHPSAITGEMRSTYAQSLDSWHFGDDYSSMPVLSSSWLQEDKGNVDRALAVTSSVSNQLFGDFFIKNRCTRCMPLYSIPGLIDHH